MSFFCTYCGQEIPAEVIAARHYSPGHLPRRVFCNHEHANAYRQEHGEYKQMSTIGKDARSKAVIESNKINPRRRHAKSN